MGPPSFAEEGVFGGLVPEPLSRETMGVRWCGSLSALLWSWGHLQDVALSIILPYRTFLFAG